MSNYYVIRVERKTAEFLEINSSVKKGAQNKEKNTSEDYCFQYLRVVSSSKLDPNLLILDTHTQFQF